MNQPQVHPKLSLFFPSIFLIKYTGLDAFTAHNIVDTLRRIARQGRIVVCRSTFFHLIILYYIILYYIILYYIILYYIILYYIILYYIILYYITFGCCNVFLVLMLCVQLCSIHQPRTDIFHMFDSVILLTKGDVAYFGPSSNVLDHFTKLGHECPNDTNPADFLCMHLRHLHPLSLTFSPSLLQNDSTADSIRCTSSSSFYLLIYCSVDITSIDDRDTEKEAESTARVKSIVTQWTSLPLPLLSPKPISARPNVKPSYISSKPGPSPTPPLSSPLVKSTTSPSSSSLLLSTPPRSPNSMSFRDLLATSVEYVNSVSHLRPLMKSM